ncbi:MAG: methylated-DNA--[protein]-cysteine S-methyltransferase [Gallionellaceae bacterium]|jgi:methylated-DNA-[protein]-cysteine S-methyltransferase|nr:methylated-DNA--[protein]-cysteine S-methyltransferase [Gallionellaceae bacterium]
MNPSTAATLGYQAKLKTPFGVLGICCSEEKLTGIAFLPPQVKALSPQNALAREVCGQLSAYLADAGFHFDLPLDLAGTDHQRRVWHAMCAIPCGQVRTYGDLAAEMRSSPRAVGQACGNNPIPVVVPCHRIVGKHGLVGFMHHSGGRATDIKRWLLEHEHALPDFA